MFTKSERKGAGLKLFECSQGTYLNHFSLSSWLLFFKCTTIAGHSAASTLDFQPMALNCESPKKCSSEMMGSRSFSLFFVFVLEKMSVLVPLSPFLSSVYIPKCSSQSTGCLGSPIIHSSVNYALCLMCLFRLRTVCLPLWAAVFI